jgi:hypothetical protein
MQQTALYVSNGYGQIREQFGLPVGKFHAIAGLIAQMSAELYASDAARRFTAAALDKGERPSVASAILKVQLTEAGRRAVNHGMDILGGKGIISGPSNLLGVRTGRRRSRSRWRAPTSSRARSSCSARGRCAAIRTCSMKWPPCRPTTKPRSARR